jgi:hypothetical protein
MESVSVIRYNDAVVICAEEKSTRCHSMICCSCELLYMFRALICPSSGGPRLYFDYNMRCLVPELQVVGRQVRGSRLCVQREREVTVVTGEYNNYMWKIKDKLSSTIHIIMDTNYI